MMGPPGNCMPSQNSSKETSTLCWATLIPTRPFGPSCSACAAAMSPVMSSARSEPLSPRAGFASSSVTSGSGWVVIVVRMRVLLNQDVEHAGLGVAALGDRDLHAVIREGDLVLDSRDDGGEQRRGAGFVGRNNSRESNKDDRNERAADQ